MKIATKEEFVEAMRWLNVLSLVKTPDGVGTLLCINIPYNGLYHEWERAKFLVWYGTGNNENGWVNREYNVEELSPVLC